MLTPQELWIDARARELCKEAEMPQGAYQLFIPDASAEYVTRILDTQTDDRDVLKEGTDDAQS